MTYDIVWLEETRFTTPLRTPWAGQWISKSFKERFGVGSAKIGESWEFSCDPELPSIVKDSGGQTLVEWLTRNPDSIGRNTNCNLLVKVIEAETPLSVQVHPSDGDPSLAPNECGKPESWLVLDAAPGAGVYLGFNRFLSKSQLREMLNEQADLSSVMQFVPVEPGDYFEIPPGVVHSLGPGVAILEPQRCLAGRSGKTFRVWDWNRRYSSEGKQIANGTPRALHIEESLRIIQPESQIGDAFVSSLRRQLNEELGFYPANDHYQVGIFKFSHEWFSPRANDYAFALMLEGSCHVLERTVYKGSGFMVCRGYSFRATGQGTIAFIRPV